MYPSTLLFWQVLSSVVFSALKWWFLNIFSECLLARSYFSVLNLKGSNRNNVKLSCKIILDTFYVKGSRNLLCEGKYIGLREKEKQISQRISSIHFRSDLPLRSLETLDYAGIRRLIKIWWTPGISTVWLCCFARTPELLMCGSDFPALESRTYPLSVPFLTTIQRHLQDNYNAGKILILIKLMMHLKLSSE